MDIFFQYLNEFWTIVASVWNSSLFGLNVGRVLIAIGVFFAFMGLRHLISRFLLSTLDRLARRTKLTFDDKAVHAAAGPVRFIPVVLGVYFAFVTAGVSAAEGQFGGSVVRSLIAVTIFWALYNSVSPLSVAMHRLDRVLTREMIDWAVKALKVLVVILGGVAVLDFWGINVGPVIAGLGLFGVAVALGAQDLFKNLIAGLLILSERRFHKGDWIRVEGVVEGTVELIGFRSTRIRRFDKAPVQVPNTQLSDNPVTNFSQMTHRRIYWMIGVEYGTTVAQLRRIRDEIENYVLDSEDFAGPEEVPTFVRIDKFGESSIDLMLYCFTKTTVWAEWLKIKEELACKIKEIVEGAGTGFAFPSRTLYMEWLPGEKPELFVPPKDEAAAPKAAAKSTGKAANGPSAKTAAKSSGRKAAKKAAAKAG